MARGNELLRQAHYAEAEAVFSRLAAAEPRDPDAQFALALSRALQGRLDEALSGFQVVLSLDAGRADACFEAAAILLKGGRYREAFRWARRGLRLDPASDYGLELAGSLHFLLGARVEALRYWNRLQRPHLTNMEIQAGPVSRYSIAEEIHLSPGDLLSADELDRASWRLAQHGHLRRTEFNPVPGLMPDEYGLEVLADARSGLGSPSEWLFHTLGDIAFSTLRFAYWNIRNTGATIHMPVRWNPDARWFRFQLESPRPSHLPVYLTARYEWRDESWFWTGKESRSGPSFRLRTHELGARMRFPLRLPRLAASAHLSYRRRNFEPGAGDGQVHIPAADPLSPESSDGAMWIGVAPTLRLVRTETPVGWGFRSDWDWDLGWARLYGDGRQFVSRISAGLRNEAVWKSEDGLQTSLQLGLHAGHASRRAPLEDHFILGVGPDADFPLRAHLVFRDGAKGNAAVARDFALGSFTWRQEAFRWQLLRFGFIAYADAARIWNAFPGQEGRNTLLDTGAGIELGSSMWPQARFTFAYGRDWKGKRNSFYLGASFP